MIQCIHSFSTHTKPQLAKKFPANSSKQPVPHPEVSSPGRDLPPPIQKPVQRSRCQHLQSWGPILLMCTHPPLAVDRGHNQQTCWQTVFRKCKDPEVCKEVVVEQGNLQLVRVIRGSQSSGRVSRGKSNKPLNQPPNTPGSMESSVSCRQV